MLDAKRRSIGAFAFLAATVWTAVYWATRLPGAVARPALVGAAGLADLLITVPVLFYFVVVRRGFASTSILAGIFLAGATAAGFLLPAAEQAHLPAARWIGAPFELWVIFLLIRRLRRAERGEDMLARIRSTARAIVPYDRVAEFFAAEIAVFYYALFSWRAKPDNRMGCVPFAYAEASGLLNLSTLMILSLIWEGPLLHLVIASKWNLTAAWILTGLDLYGLIWLVAVRRSARMRPILVGSDGIRLRWGLLWEVELAWTNIARCTRVTGAAPGRREPGYLRMAIITDPQWVVELNRPTIAHGLLGQRRRVTRIGVAVDEAERFGAVLGIHLMR